MSLSELRALAAESYDGVRQKVWTEPDPAAGADFTITVPGPQFWLPVALTATLTTSDADGGRSPVLEFTDGTTVIAQVIPGGGADPSTAVEVSWIRLFPFVGASGSGLSLSTSLPDITLPTGWTIGVATENLDAADQWTAIALTALQITGGQPAQALRREDALYEHWEAMNALIGTR